MDSHELAAWWIRTEAERIRRNPQPMNPDLLAALVADVATDADEDEPFDHYAELRDEDRRAER